MQKYALKIWYIGNNFGGSQRNPNKRSVEKELISVLIQRGYILSSIQSQIRFAARTDIGVHARALICSFISEKKIHITEIDAFLPNDMGVWAWADVPSNFNPRFDALYKIYFYTYVIKQSEKLDINKIRQTASKLEGKHNFGFFSKKDHTRLNRSTIITLNSIEILEFPDHLLFKFNGDAFLWQLIRRLVSYLLMTGRNESSEYVINDLLKGKYNENTQRPHPENPEGLLLWHIEYPDSIIFTENRKCKQRMKESFLNTSSFHLSLGFTLRLIRE